MTTDTNKTRSPASACRAALIQSFAQSHPAVTLDDKGYVAHFTNNLLPGVTPDAFEADLRQGDGNELEGKFRAAHSSSALAVNTFAPFKSKLADLRLPGGENFHSLSFERKCHHGLAGRRSPNLDVVAESTGNVVAIESKCLETLSPHTAKFAPAYLTEISDERRETAWFRELLRLVEAPKSYRWLDAAQLIKHALGVMHTFDKTPATLLYLFWEPSNPDDHAAFAEHRAEIARFSEAVTDEALRFTAISYPELWRDWQMNPRHEWVATHVSHLLARYGVSV